MSHRLLQAIAGAPYGGAEIFFSRLAAALQRAGERQRVLIRRNPARAQSLRGSGVAVVELTFGGFLDLATRLAFRREIAAWHPRIVLTWMSRATRLCPSGNFVHVARLGGYYDVKNYRRCDYLIGNTQAIVEYAVAEGWPRERVEYLPNFAPDLGARGKPAPTGARTQHGGPRLAVALGRLHPNKGFDLLLEALAKTRDIHLWIAGDGPLRSNLEREASDLGIADRVRFLGWREDAPSLLARADLLVCPSLHEPLGNVVIEAWSAGLPVVATATDGPASLIEDGVSGILVPLPDSPGGGPSTLARAIEQVCEDRALRARLGRAGRRAYEASFTEQAVVAQYRQFFDRIAA
jgi:glycosyltransferase involved in cell wall biosynthesis